MFDSGEGRSGPDTGTWVAGGVVITLMIGIMAVFFASPSPDGLERVAEELGFIGGAQDSAINLLKDYAVPGIANENAASALAIIIGTLLIFAIGLGIARSLRRRRQPVPLQDPHHMTEH